MGGQLLSCPCPTTMISTPNGGQRPFANLVSLVQPFISPCTLIRGEHTLRLKTPLFSFSERVLKQVICETHEGSQRTCDFDDKCRHVDVWSSSRHVPTPSVAKWCMKLLLDKLTDWCAEFEPLVPFNFQLLSQFPRSNKQRIRKQRSYPGK